MKTKVISSAEEHIASLEELNRLIALNPSAGSPSFDKLHLLATLISNYENQRFSFDLPDPIEAIKFRMEEQGLKQIDLIPYIGSKSKVSEVLSGKRSLTLPMIRSLHEGLGISAEVLLQEQKRTPTNRELNFTQFPVKELVKRGWIKESVKSYEKAVEHFLAPLLAEYSQPILWRRKRDSSELEEKKFYALISWTAVILNTAQKIKSVPIYDKQVVNRGFLKEVARLSYFDHGPLLAKEFLLKNGIILVIEPTFPSAKIDGATMYSHAGNPIVALTLRYDRLDYFWFTLMHELAHVMKHLKNPQDVYIDDFDESDQESDFEVKEKEADFLAKDSFVPRDVWSRSEAMRIRTPESVRQLSEEYRIHPAILAGRIQRETNNYTILRDMLGDGKVRSMFQGE
jgi:HTH-type transcriptional regulator / antitoxin HigA